MKKKKLEPIKTKSSFRPPDVDADRKILKEEYHKFLKSLETDEGETAINKISELVKVLRYKNLLFGCAGRASIFVTIFPFGHPQWV